MLDIKAIRLNKEKIEENLSRRGKHISLDSILVLDKKKRTKIQLIEDKKSFRNKVSKEIGKRKSQGEDVSDIIKEVVSIRDEISEIDNQIKAIDEELESCLLMLPNLLDASVPIGENYKENQEVRRFGEPKKFSFEPKAHYDIGADLDILDFERGVGKSLVTSMLAILMNRKGYKTAILDADITGPSIPKAFGIKEKAEKNNHGLLPVESQSGIQIMSLNLLLENESDAVIWRGPLITGVVKQFWTDVIWRDVDYMFIDMPPGTGDVPLTVFQSINIDGIIIVTSPQDLVSMIVGKTVNMAKNMNIPILGLTENMSYVTCPNCQKKIKVFGESKLEENATKYNIELIGKIPLDPKISAACDLGEIEKLKNHWLDHFIPILKTI